MTKAIKTTKTTKRTHDQAPDAEPATPYLDLASDALLAGMTREQVVAQLVIRIKRDQGYLAYRKASGRRTRYDEQVMSDLRALALAAMLLEDPAKARPPRGQPPGLLPGEQHPSRSRPAP